MNNSADQILNVLEKVNARTLLQSLSVECDDEDLIDDLISSDGQMKSVDKIYSLVKDNPDVLRFKLGKTLIPTDYVYSKLLLLAGRPA